MHVPSIPVRCFILSLSILATGCASHGPSPPPPPDPASVLQSLREFYARTARPDGSFSPGIDPDYLGMSDSAYSDLAAVTYAVTIHKTFGWQLPHEKKTAEFLLSRQRTTGEFFNIAGTVSPDSAEGKTYNTTQALVALKALGVKPLHDPLPVFEEILKQDYKTLPAYSTSFFPLAYLCYGRTIPEKADRGIRALMIQDETGYMNDHIAATYHASHYYRLVGEATPKAQEMVARALRDQNADGSWLINMPSRDRHGTFDAVFVLHQEGQGRIDCDEAVQRAADWALSCRNADGGFGHFPRSTSDADAIYFQVGTLVMAGFLKPADPPPDPQLLSWGHLMPVRVGRDGPELWSVKAEGWIGSLAFSPDSKSLVAGIADNTARVFDAATGRETVKLEGHFDRVTAVRFSPDGRSIATGGYDHTAQIWDAATGRLRQLDDHGSAVLAVVFSPDSQTLATGGIDGTIKLWPTTGGVRSDRRDPQATLTGHRSWVNSLAFTRDGLLVSGSSDGTVKIWSLRNRTREKTLDATKAEVRSVACSADGRWIAAGMRYGMVKVWDAKTFEERFAFQGHESDVWSLAFTPDSATLVTGNGDWNRGGHVKLWSMETGKQTGQFQHTGEVLSLAVSPDGARIAAAGGDGRIRVWWLGKR